MPYEYVPMSTDLVDDTLQTRLFEQQESHVSQHTTRRRQETEEVHPQLWRNVQREDWVCRSKTNIELHGASLKLGILYVLGPTVNIRPRFNHLCSRSPHIISSIVNSPKPCVQPPSTCPISIAGFKLFDP